MSLRIACWLAFLALLPASAPAGELVISTGREGGSYHAIGQRLRSALRALEADLKASNGIIHIIDRVLLPPTE